MQNMQSTNGFLINIKFEVMCLDSVPFLDTAFRLIYSLISTSDGEEKPVYCERDEDDKWWLVR